MAAQTGTWRKCGHLKASRADTAGAHVQHTREASLFSVDMSRKRTSERARENGGDVVSRKEERGYL